IAILGLLLGLAPLILVLVGASLLAGLHALVYVLVSQYWALSDRTRKIPYGMYLGLAAFSVALTPLNSVWYSWCSSWCSTGS
ncbi:MAG: prepilin peptidase, partial [Achromobacter kerstersii]